MARGLIILNDASYGTERSYNGIRFAGAVSKCWRVGGPLAT
jgi:sulfur relay (sulfurtransferase) complex TusBCD TusD component (DsrE family)